jgi:hypothetical protein
LLKFRDNKQNSNYLKVQSSMVLSAALTVMSVQFVHCPFQNRLRAPVTLFVLNFDSSCMAMTVHVYDSLLFECSDLLLSLST